MTKPADSTRRHRRVKERRVGSVPHPVCGSLVVVTVEGHVGEGELVLGEEGRLAAATRAAQGTASRPPRQCAGISTYEASSCATDAHPSSLRVRTSSARRIWMAFATPASPPAPRP